MDKKQAAIIVGAAGLLLLFSAAVTFLHPNPALGRLTYLPFVVKSIIGALALYSGIKTWKASRSPR